MKMRKFFVVALAALGAAAAFSSCKKETFDGPEIEVRDSQNAMIVNFSKASFGTDPKSGIKVYVTLGDASLSLKNLKVSVKHNGGEILKPTTIDAKPVKGGSDDGKFEAVLTYEKTKLTDAELSKPGLMIVFEAEDSQAKTAKVELPYGEKPAGTPMKNENTAAFVNHAFGEGRGAYSFSGKKAVTALDEGGTDREIVNLSVSGEPFVHKFGSKAGFTFVKLNSGDVDYATATAEKVGELIKDAKTEIELAKGDMFIAVAKGGKTFYLAKVTELKDDGYYADGAEKATASTNKGYILFSYKSNN